jgi:hypothetical protein
VTSRYPAGLSTRVCRAVGHVLPGTIEEALDCLATLATHVVVVGDVKVRLDWPEDHANRQLTTILAARRLSGRVDEPTHVLHGSVERSGRRRRNAGRPAGSDGDVIDAGRRHPAACGRRPLSRCVAPGGRLI